MDCRCGNQAVRRMHDQPYAARKFFYLHRCTPDEKFECGTDPDLNNCFYQGKTRDIYRVGGEKPPLPDGCPELEPVARAACPDPGEVPFFTCDAPGLNAWGMLCKSNDAECLTSKELNNCDYLCPMPSVASKLRRLDGVEVQ